MGFASREHLPYSRNHLPIRSVAAVAPATRAPVQEEYDSNALSTLRGARIVGMTTSGVAKSQKLVAGLRPKARGAGLSTNTR